MPKKGAIMDESLAKIRHDRSKKDFPWLRLEDGEYVEFAFKRARICLVMILSGTFFALIAILLGFLLMLIGQSMLDEMGKNFIYIILSALLAAVVIITIVSLRIYRGNWLFITNKRVIQMLRTSLVANSVNMIDLSSIEDASFRQNGILQKIFKYGTLRLSTVGDETTYTFPYSDIRPEDLEAISKLLSRIKEAKLANKNSAE